MTTDLEGLAARVRHIEDRLAISELRYRYCYAIDERDWDALVPLFTENATLDYGGLGTYDGHDGVREFATEFVETSLSATAHAVHNPIIELDGDEATGQWYVTSPITYDDGSGGFRWGRYEEEYRRVDDEWRIDSLRLRFVYSVDYEDGSWPDFDVFPQG